MGHRQLQRANGFCCALQSNLSTNFDDSNIEKADSKILDRDCGNECIVHFHITCFWNWLAQEIFQGAIVVSRVMKRWETVSG